MKQCVHEPLFVIGGEPSNFSFKMYTNQMDGSNNHNNNNHYHQGVVGQYSHTTSTSSSSVSASLLSNLLSELDLKTALAIVGVIWAVTVWLVSCLGNVVVFVLPSVSLFSGSGGGEISFPPFPLFFCFSYTRCFVFIILPGVNLDKREKK